MHCHHRLPQIRPQRILRRWFARPPALRLRQRRRRRAAATSLPNHTAHLPAARDRGHACHARDLGTLRLLRVCLRDQQRPRQPLPRAATSRACRPTQTTRRPLAARHPRLCRARVLVHGVAFVHRLVAGRLRRVPVVEWVQLSLSPRHHVLDLRSHRPHAPAFRLHHRRRHLPTYGLDVWVLRGVHLVRAPRLRICRPSNLARVCHLLR